MTDEEKVQAALDKLANLRANQEEDEYNFFFQADLVTQQTYYEYWIKVHAEHDIPMPRFLIDFEKAHILS